MSSLINPNLSPEMMGELLQAIQKMGLDPTELLAEMTPENLRVIDFCVGEYKGCSLREIVETLHTTDFGSFLRS